MAEGGAPPVENAEEFPDDDPFTVDITDIALNVKYQLIGMFMDKEGPVKDIFNWKETPDLGDAWFDHNKELRKYAYYGEKPRKLKAPVRDFLKHCMPCLKGSRELQAAEADIQRTIARYGNRRIEIYNVCAVITYLSAAKGVTVDPYYLTSFLNYKKIRSAGKSFKSTRTNYNERIDVKIKTLNDAILELEDNIRRVLKFYEDNYFLVQEPLYRDKSSRKVIHIQRSMYLKAFFGRTKLLKKRYDDLGTYFWDVQLTGVDANEFLFDFLLTYIPNLCKLNPPPTGEKPTLLGND